MSPPLKRRNTPRSPSTRSKLPSPRGDVVLLDANGTDSWQKGHIPGAIDFQSEKDKLASVLPKDKNALIVAYCACPGCPYYLKAADAAVKLGYTNVKHFTPGIYGWRESGEPVGKGQLARDLEVRLPLVPKLHLGTHLSLQLHCPAFTRNLLSSLRGSPSKKPESPR